MKNIIFLILFVFFVICSKSYAENMCYTSSSTSDTGTIYDSGGSGGYYTNYENCGFLIQPSSSPSSITLSFSQFNVDNGWDFLSVYDGTNSSGTLLGTFTGFSLPANVTAASGSMYLRFTSDYTDRFSGFAASWTSTTGSSSCDSVEDDFSSLSYSNNDGTQNWTNAWQETGESDGVSAGKVRVRNDNCSSGYCLRLGTPSGTTPSNYSNRGAIRQVDLTDATSATLTFNYFTGVSSGSSTVVLSVSNNGGSSWTSLKTYTISSSNFSANPESFDISAYASANTQIRFLSSGSSSSVSGMYIDDLKIDYCQLSSSSSCVIFRDEFSTESYSRQDGTANWSSNWNEVSDDDNASTGDIEISSNVLQFEGEGSGSTALGAPYIERQADLSSYTTATLSFDYYESGDWESDDDIEIYVSSNGGSSWNLIHTFTNDQGSSTQQFTQDISSYIANNTRIAFVEKANSSSERFYFDNVQIEACAVAGEADLIASYNFDDDWVTNSSLTDQTGSYDGNPSGSVSQVSAGASGSKGDTCYAGSFNGGEIDITGLPVSTSTGATTSISFWMYWDGTNDVTVTGWYKYDLWLYNSLFGFNTWGSDITGISSSGLSSGWHHIAAVYTNGSVSNNKLYVDGVLQSISHLRGSIYTSNAVVQSSLRIGGAFFGGYRFSGKLDNFKVYDGTITQAQVTTDMNESGACPSIDTPAVAFNCVENGSNGITGKLYTKTTAQSFSFDIVALRDSSTLETSFADGADHTVTVELVDSSSGGSCSAYTALSPAVSQSILFTSSDAGKKATATMNSGTAYSSVACRVTDATDSPSIVDCSTDSFSIRPTNFTLTSSLTYTDPFSTPTAKAGDNFTLTATTTTGYTGTPLIDTSKLQAHSGAIKTGTLAGFFSAAVAGVATGTSFTYSEVGSMRFAAEGIYDETFTSVDPSTECTADFSNAVVSKKVGCKFGNTATTSYFGRFTPDHFEVAGSTTGIFSNACTGFTYNGQAFGYQTAPTLTVTAYNGLSPSEVTENYTGPDFMKLSATDFVVPAPTTDTTQLGADGSNLINLFSWIPGPATLNDNTDGSLTFAFGNDNFTYSHENNSKIAPFTSTIDLKFTTIKDSDNIVTQSLPHTVQASGTSIRFGRLSVNNAHGSELLPLSVQLTTEYFNGTSFIHNTSDSCTNFTLANNFSISDAADFNCSFATQTSPVAVGSGSVKATLSNTTVSGGTSELLISDNSSTSNGPGAGNTGYIEITTDLSNLSWLKYDWDANSTHAECPSSRATFGIYKGNNKQIYFREVY